MTRATWLFAASIFVAAPPAAAQLRPLEPIPWRVLRQGTTVAAELGASRLYEQRASLAGTSGTLTELGNFSLAWRTGRVALEAAGTGQRLLEEKSRFADPYPGVQSARDKRRNDSGDYRLSTSIRITPDTYPVTGVFRFGTRLPTTDNTTGLDRDAIDFFATVGASGIRGILNISGEAGLGVYGTRETRFEQDDLFLYALRAELHLGQAFTPEAMVIGQQHGYAHSAIRGVENLSEIRVGLRYGDNKWIRAEAVKGMTIFSPSGGILITAGFVR
ncbi:MAG: hypothetical protein ABIQ55_12040 [Gemmatimonadaceae bacterium]